LGASPGFAKDFDVFFPDTIPVAPGAASTDWPTPRRRAQNPHRFKLLTASIVVSVVLLILARPEAQPGAAAAPDMPAHAVTPPSLQGDRFHSNVKKVQALQAHRTLAGVCVDAIRQRAPEITARGKPTLIHIEGPLCDEPCMSAQRHSEQVHARWTELHLNGIWVSTQTPRDASPSALRRLDVPACASLVAGQERSTRLVLDRDGDLFFAGEQENRLKARLWVTDPASQTSKGERHGISILLESGTPLHDAEAVQMVTWARVCKWHLGECVSVAKQQRAVRRLDETSPEKLVEAGEAEAKRLNFYRSR
jgi:hypothetical protein